MTRDELIYISLRLLGVGVDEEPIEQAEIDHASQRLNMMVKAWTADGLQLWARTWDEIPLTEGKYKYILGPGGDLDVEKPLRILECSRVEGDNRIPMTALSESGYWDMVNWSNKGVPINYFFLPKVDQSEFYVWPSPDAYSADNVTISISYHRPFDTMQDSEDRLDFPEEYHEAVAYGLALRLAPEYGIDHVQRGMLRTEYRMAYEAARMWDVEDVAVQFEPDPQMRY